MNENELPKFQPGETVVWRSRSKDRIGVLTPVQATVVKQSERRVTISVAVGRTGPDGVRRVMHESRSVDPSYLEREYPNVVQEIDA